MSGRTPGTRDGARGARPGRRRRCATRPTRRLVRSVRATLLLAGAAVLLVGAAGPARAHDVLVSTTPMGGSTVTATPAEVVLTFDQPALALGTALKVVGPAGDVADGQPQLVNNEVRQGLRPGSPPGSYTVSWRVTSADGHTVSGTFGFTSTGSGSGAPQPAASTAVTARADAAPPGDRSFVGPLVVLGLVMAVTLALLLERDRRSRRQRSSRSAPG